MRVAALLLAFCILVAATQQSTSAQDGATGQISVFVYLDVNNNGEFNQEMDRTNVEESCRVLLLPEIVEPAVGLDAPNLPVIDEAVPDNDGRATIEVPPGRYKVAYANCAPTPSIRSARSRGDLAISEYREYEPGCCPHVEGTPNLVVVESAFTGALFLAHDVEVTAGVTSELTLRAYPSTAPSDELVWRVAWIGTGVFVFLIIAGLITARYRRRV